MKGFMWDCGDAFMEYPGGKAGILCIIGDESKPPTGVFRPDGNYISWNPYGRRKAGVGSAHLDWETVKQPENIRFFGGMVTKALKEAAL